jgi:GH24 family phage-related lysozyme (muramidase)
MRARWRCACPTVGLVLICAAAAAAPAPASARGAFDCAGGSADRAAAAAASGCDASSVDDNGMQQIEREEGFRDHPYNDSRKFCTIGVGHLLHKSKCTAADERKWSHVSKAELEDLFRKDLGKFERQMNALKRKLRIKLNQCQYDALTSLLFNGGPSWFVSPKSRMYKALARRDFAAMPRLIEEAVPSKADPKTRRRLAARRKREAKEFTAGNCCKPRPLSGTFGGTATNPFYGYTLAWSGSATLTPSFTRLGPGEANDTWEYYTLTSGTVTWRVSGTWNGCTWSGSGTGSLGTQPEAFELELGGPPDSQPRYYLNIEGAQTTLLAATLTCPGDSGPAPVGYGGGEGAWAYSNLGPTTDGQSVSGSYSNTNQHWHWDMQFQ